MIECHTKYGFFFGNGNPIAQCGARAETLSADMSDINLWLCGTQPISMYCHHLAVQRAVEHEFLSDGNSNSVLPVRPCGEIM